MPTTCLLVKPSELRANSVDTLSLLNALNWDELSD